jgi:glutathione S-transferase
MLLNPWVAVVTALSLIFVVVTGLRVGRARHKHGIAAPAMTGHPDFERAVRIQANTLEWVVVYLPALWMFAQFVEPRIACLLGLVWIAGRVMYMNGYAKEAGKRGPGFGVQFLATAILLLGGLTGAILQLTRGG